jgi:hypothetical protein
VNCPYPDCHVAKLPPDTESCQTCQRFLKACARCRTYNRAFANFCRLCRTALAPAEGNWLGYLGGSQRFGVNTARPAEPPGASAMEVVDTGAGFRLARGCRSLLAYDRHLIAFSHSSIEVIDPVCASTHHVVSINPPTCEPCVHRGVVYVGSQKALSAYSLGAFTLDGTRPPLLWQIPLPGHPIQALLPLDNRLYVMVGYEGRRELQVVDNLGLNARPELRTVHAGSTLSWFAGDPKRKQVVCFSEEGGDVHLHTITDGAGAEPTSRRVEVPPMSDQPIAFDGRRVFAVSGEDRRLLVIDAASARFEQSLGSQTVLFALNQNSDGEWNGDATRIERLATTNVVFNAQQQHDTLAAQDRVVKGTPLILRDRAAVVAMEDGQIRFYDLARLPRFSRWRVSDSGDGISALVSFRNYVAAGTTAGDVKVFELTG